MLTNFYYLFRKTIYIRYPLKLELINGTNRNFREF